MGDFQKELQKLNVGNFKAQEAVDWGQSDPKGKQIIFGCFGCAGCFSCFSCFRCFRCSRCFSCAGRCY